MFRLYNTRQPSSDLCFRNVEKEKYIAVAIHIKVNPFGSDIALRIGSRSLLERSYLHVL